MTDRNGRYIFKIYVKKDQLHVDAIIRGLDDKILAVINNNEWDVFSDNYEYNNNKTAFELVTEGDRKVFFQLEYKNGIAHFMGFIISDNNNMYLYAPQGKSGAMMTPLSEIIAKGFPAEAYNTLFKYPRETHLGEKN